MIEPTWREAQANLVRKVGGNNALANAGALVDDDAPIRASTSKSTASTSASTTKPTVRDLPNQKLSLLRALLTIGDIKRSLFIIAQYPYLVSVYPDIADLLNRLLAESIKPAYDSIATMKEVRKTTEAARVPRTHYSTTTKTQVPPMKPTAFISARAFPKIESSRLHTFFFAEWKERLPLCEDSLETLEVLEIYLPIIGFFISNDFPLFTKLCRIICQDLEVS